MSRPLYLVDAFANGPFTGNPAGVCLLDHPAETEWMQSVAMEMNQAETAFVRPLEEGYELRWLTPTVEVDLCGHATLATAHVLFQLDAEARELSFHTRSGRLTAARVDDRIELDFPAEPPVETALPFKVDCLGAEPIWTGCNRMDWFVRLPSVADVRGIQPNFEEIARLGMRGIIMTALDETGEYDFVSRCFFPCAGVPEDSVTGSAHCALSAFWTAELGRADLTGYQASRRGGVVETIFLGERVKLRGRAVTTLTGTLAV